MKKTQDRWSGAHVRLKRLFDERAKLTQEEFGATYGLGSQGMVWQYLSGHRPLNFEAAAKFAKGLGCTIADISPEMAEALREEILPVLGRVKSIAKAAVWMLAGVPPLLASAEAIRASVLCQIRHVRLRTGASAQRAI